MYPASSLRYRSVSPSKGTIPDVAPASTDMLLKTIRALWDILAIAGPWNSRTLKLAPSAVRRPIRWRMRSLDITWGGNSPTTSTLMVGGTSTLSMLPKVQTEAISVAPIPKAKAPKEPWEVV